MKFFVYKKTKAQFVLIAQTLYKEDAESILKNWHSGYVASGDEIVFKKNLP